MRRTWYRKKSDGTFFRNCPLIMREREQAISPRARRRLEAEWERCFREGAITAEQIGRRDRWIDFDDSPEATGRWAQRFLAAPGGKLEP